MLSVELGAAMAQTALSIETGRGTSHDGTMHDAMIDETRISSQCRNSYSFEDSSKTMNDCWRIVNALLLFARNIE